MKKEVRGKLYMLLNDFVAYLTTREKTIKVGSKENVYDIMEELKKYTKKEGIEMPE